MFVIFNAQCSKCAGLAGMLSDLNWQAIDYLNGELTPDLLDTIFHHYDGPVTDLVRTGESLWREAGYSLEMLDVEALKKRIHAHPILLQRPIVIRGKTVLVARPPEKVWDLLGDIVH